MVAQREPQRMTVDEWRELERTSHDIKHEYIDGLVYAMAGESLAHGRISSNAIRTLEDALAARGQPPATCTTQMSPHASRSRASPIPLRP
jgi:Uma2 family endonuclease